MLLLFLPESLPERSLPVPPKVRWQFNSAVHLVFKSHVDVMICFQTELKTQFFYKKPQSKVEKAREEVQAALAKQNWPQRKDIR